MNIEGTYIYTPSKKELKRTYKKGQKKEGIYSIRLGNQNPSLVFFNHTNFTVVQGTCVQHENEYIIYYGSVDSVYTFTLKSEGKKQVIEVARKGAN